MYVVCVCKILSIWVSNLAYMDVHKIMHIHTRIHTHIQTLIHTYTYTCIHTYIHTYCFHRRCRRRRESLVSSSAPRRSSESRCRICYSSPRSSSSTALVVYVCMYVCMHVFMYECMCYREYWAFSDGGGADLLQYTTQYSTLHTVRSYVLDR